MVRLREEFLTAACLLLLFIVVSPNFFVISQTGSIPTLLRVEERQSVEWVSPNIGVCREPKMADKYVRIEEWTNGTKVCYASHIYLYDPECRDMWVNFTSWIPQNATTQQASRLSSESSQLLSEGNLPKELTDGNWFIYGSNSTCFTTYKHDDNYETYYPLQWNYPFALQGTTRTHTHIPAAILDSWYNGNFSDFLLLLICCAPYIIVNYLSGDLIEIIRTGGEAITDEVAGRAVKMISEAYKAPINVILYGFWVAASNLIEFIEAAYGYGSKCWWIDHVVREWFGRDGWSWGDDYCFFPVYTVVSCSRYYIPTTWPPFGGEYWVNPRARFDYYEVATFEASFGSEGIFSGTPHESILAWCTKTVYKATYAIAR